MACHLAHPGAGNPLLLTETFSISGLMTPAKPVSYKNASADVNNGFGTLAEAGGGRSRPYSTRAASRGARWRWVARAARFLYGARAGACVQLLLGKYMRKNN